MKSHVSNLPRVGSSGWEWRCTDPQLWESPKSIYCILGGRGESYSILPISGGTALAEGILRLKDAKRIAELMTRLQLKRSAHSKAKRAAKQQVRDAVLGVHPEALRITGDPMIRMLTAIKQAKAEAAE